MVPRVHPPKPEGHNPTALGCPGCGPGAWALGLVCPAGPARQWSGWEFCLCVQGTWLGIPFRPGFKSYCATDQLVVWDAFLGFLSGGTGAVVPTWMVNGKLPLMQPRLGT